MPACAAAPLQVLVQVARLADAELMTGVIEVVNTALLDVPVEGLQEQVGPVLHGLQLPAACKHKICTYSVTE